MNVATLVMTAPQAPAANGVFISDMTAMEQTR